MNDMNGSRNLLAKNLQSLRKINRYSLESVAERIGVSRQAAAKWESGESIPDLINCDALAALYGVSLDDLVHYDQEKDGVVGVPPKNKHLYGTVQIGERGQIVLPKKARDAQGLKAGDMLVVLGDTSPESAGIALLKEESFMEGFRQMRDILENKENQE